MLAMSDHIEAPNLYANADTHTYGEPSLIEAATVAAKPRPLTYGRFKSVHSQTTLKPEIMQFR